MSGLANIVCLRCILWRACASSGLLKSCARFSHEAGKNALDLGRNGGWVLVWCTLPQDDDHVRSLVDIIHICAEPFTNFSFPTVARHRIPDSFRGDHPKSRGGVVVSNVDDHDEVLAATRDPAALHSQVFRPLANAAVR